MIYTKEGFDRVIADIRGERDYQNNKWGSEFDEKNTPNDWVAYIAVYLGRAVTMPWHAFAFRNALIKVAALAVAAVEIFDAKNGKLAPRHYDPIEQPDNKLTVIFNGNEITVEFSVGEPLIEPIRRAAKQGGYSEVPLDYQVRNVDGVLLEAWRKIDDLSLQYDLKNRRIFVSPPVGFGG